MTPKTKERLKGDLAIARIRWRRNFNAGIINDGSKLSAQIAQLVTALGDRYDDGVSRLSPGQQP